MALGDVAGGPNPAASTPEPTKGSFDMGSFNVPMGENPFFPTQEPDPQVGEPEQSASQDPSTNTPEIPVEPAAPTFDPATDRQAGINVESSEYKHFQAAFTRARQNDKSTLEQRMDQFEADRVREQITPEVEAQPTNGALQVRWQGYQMPVLQDQESPLSGCEGDIIAIVQHAANHIIGDIYGQQVAALQTQNANVAKQKVGDFVTSIDDPAKAHEAVTLLREYNDIARNKPDQFIAFATHQLGLAPTAPAPAAPTAPAPTGPSDQRLRVLQQNATPRPTGTSFVGNTPQFKTVREAIEYELDRQMGGR